MCWATVLEIDTSSRLSQDSAAFWSAGISGRRSWICLPDTGSSSMSSSAWQLLDTQLDGWAAGGWDTGLECKCRKSRVAVDALSLTGLTSASSASASSARTREHSFSISLMFALNCCRVTEEKQFSQWACMWSYIYQHITYQHRGQNCSQFTQVFLLP